MAGAYANSTMVTLAGRTLSGLVLAAFAVMSMTVTATAQPGSDPYTWVTISNPGNAAYDGTPRSPLGPTVSPLLGRGRVDYTYRIQQTPFTLREWVGFANAIIGNTQFGTIYAELNSRAPITGRGSTPWGTAPDPTYTGPGARLILDPAFADLPAPLSWRESALICNWLHNGRQNDPTTILTGAYDTSTWGRGPNMTFTDGDRLPGALYWIPSVDEWLKAVHYDPNHSGPSQGGYWLNPWRDGDPTQTHFNGLYGFGASGDDDPEWTDTPLYDEGLSYARIVDGSSPINGQFVDTYSNRQPWQSGQTGSSPTLRLASAIPNPATSAVAGLFLICAGRRRRSDSATQCCR